MQHELVFKDDATRQLELLCSINANPPPRWLARGCTVTLVIHIRLVPAERRAQSSSDPRRSAAARPPEPPRILAAVKRFEELGEKEDAAAASGRDQLRGERMRYGAASAQLAADRYETSEVRSRLRRQEDGLAREEEVLHAAEAAGLQAAARRSALQSSTERFGSGSAHAGASLVRQGSAVEPQLASATAKARLCNTDRCAVA